MTASTEMTIAMPLSDQEIQMLRDAMRKTDGPTWLDREATARFLARDDMLCAQVKQARVEERLACRAIAEAQAVAFTTWDIHPQADPVLVAKQAHKVCANIIAAAIGRRP